MLKRKRLTVVITVVAVIYLVAVGVRFRESAGHLEFEREDDTAEANVKQSTLDTDAILPKPTLKRDKENYTVPVVSVAPSAFILKSERVNVPLDSPTNSSCCESSRGISLEVLCNRSVPGEVDEEQCNCVDYMYCRLVVLTAASSNHFEEVQDLIGSAQRFLPHTKLIIYDLGLTEDHRKRVSSYCNVELRTFPFEKYPSYFKQLKVFGWKPVMVRSVAEEYEVILYGDASVRLTGSVKDILLPLLQQFPFVTGPTNGVPISVAARDGMLDYLLPNMTRQEAFEAMPRTIHGGIFVVWATKLMKDKLLDNWADCALHEECISPKDTGPKCDGTILQTNPGAYIGCHRYDQSALNFILYREFGAKGWWSVQHDKLNKEVWMVRRYITNMYKAATCRKSR